MVVCDGSGTLHGEVLRLVSARLLFFKGDLSRDVTPRNACFGDSGTLKQSLK